MWKPQAHSQAPCVGLEVKGRFGEKVQGHTTVQLQFSRKSPVMCQRVCVFASVAMLCSPFGLSYRWVSSPYPISVIAFTVFLDERAAVGLPIQGSTRLHYRVCQSKFTSVDGATPCGCVTSSPWHSFSCCRNQRSKGRSEVASCWNTCSGSFASRCTMTISPWRLCATQTHSRLIPNRRRDSSCSRRRDPESSWYHRLHASSFPGRSGNTNLRLAMRSCTFLCWLRLPGPCDLEAARRTRAPAPCICLSSTLQCP